MARAGGSGSGAPAASGSGSYPAGECRRLGCDGIIPSPVEEIGLLNTSRKSKAKGFELRVRCFNETLKMNICDFSRVLSTYCLNSLLHFELHYFVIKSKIHYVYLY